MSPGPRLVRVGQAYVASTASVLGDVTLGRGANVWYGAVVRGDDAPIRIGARTNVQDGVVIHVDPHRPNLIGADVTIGHGALCHGVRIGDRALIGMGAILLGGSQVGEGAVIGAGTLVKEDAVVPPYALVVGVPGRVVRSLDPRERDATALETALGYLVRAKEHARRAWRWPPAPARRRRR